MPRPDSRLAVSLGPRHVADLDEVQTGKETLAVEIEALGESPLGVAKDVRLSLAGF